jgi:hypothetical protein
MMDNIIHSMGAMYVNNLDLYTWKGDITDPAELMMQAQREVSQWSLLLNATGGALKPEKCFWYLLDYTCKEGEWEYTVHSDFELYVNNPDGSKSSIEQEEIQSSKKTLGIYDSPAGGNQGQMDQQNEKWSSSITHGMDHLQTPIMVWDTLRTGYDDQRLGGNRDDF